MAVEKERTLKSRNDEGNGLPMHSVLRFYPYHELRAS